MNVRPRYGPYASASAMFPRGFPGIAASLIALSATFATSAEAAVSTVPVNGLVGYWTGDNTAVDISPTGNNGSFGGAYAPGPAGGAAFDLATGKVVIPDSSAYDFRSYHGWTVGFWFNTNGIPRSSDNGTSNRTFLSQDDGSGYRPKWLIDFGSTVFGPNNDFILHLNDFNQERIFIRSDDVIPDPVGWNQMTVVVDNDLNSVSFYLNGLPIGTRTLPPYSLGPSAPLIFGAAEPGLSYEGLMADVTIYNRALPAGEVSLLVPEPTTSLSIAWVAMPAMTLRLRRRI